MGNPKMQTMLKGLVTGSQMKILRSSMYKVIVKSGWGYYSHSSKKFEVFVDFLLFSNN